MRVEPPLTDEIYGASEPDPANSVAGGNGQGQPKHKQTRLEMLAAQFPPFHKLSELPGDAEVDWVCGKYLARGHLTMLSARWKCGKTTLLTHLVRAFGTGRNIIGDTTKCDVLYCSEESTKLWKMRDAEMSIGEHVAIINRPFKSKPSLAIWTTFCEFLALKAKEERFDVVVIDTLSKFWSCVKENDTDAVNEALTPLNHITDANIALLCCHHPRKGEGDGQISFRGSGEIGATYDIGIEMRKPKGATDSDRKRVLHAESRFDETPRELIVEWTGDDYKVVGYMAEASRQDRWRVMADILPDDPKAAMTFVEVMKSWPANAAVPCGKPRATQLDLKYGKVGDNAPFCSIGAGVRGDPIRYYRRIRAQEISPVRGDRAQNESSHKDPVTQNAINHVRGTGYERSEGKNHG